MSPCSHPIHRCRNVNSRRGVIYFCTACDLVKPTGQPWREPSKEEVDAIAASFEAPSILGGRPLSPSEKSGPDDDEHVEVDRSRFEQAYEVARWLCDGHGTHYERIDKATLLASLVLSLAEVR